MQKRQIFFIHGGNTFRSGKAYLEYLKNAEVKLEDRKRWHEDHLKRALGRSCDIIKPKMPLADNAKYEYWKVYFERYIPLLKNGAIFIGSSLGGIFLVKYLSENVFPKKIKAVLLVAPPFDNSLPDEDLVGGFRLKSDLSLLEKNCKNIHFFFSSDDPCVPLEQAYKYRKKLPSANFTVCDNANGHFKISEFPEILKVIKSLI